MAMNSEAVASGRAKVQIATLRMVTKFVTAQKTFVIRQMSSELKELLLSLLWLFCSIQWFIKSTWQSFLHIEGFLRHSINVVIEIMKLKIYFTHFVL